MMRVLFALCLALTACAAEAPTEADLTEDALVSDSMTWPGIETRGYDGMNALKCYLDGEYHQNVSCQYGAPSVCTVKLGYPLNGLWRYRLYSDFTPSRSGQTYMESALRGYTTFGPYQNKVEGSSILLREFKYSFGGRCEIRRAYGITYAVYLR